MTSGTLDILIKAETDEAQAKVEKLSEVIQKDLAKEGLGALESMSTRVDQAFAQLEVEATQRAAAINKAFSTLGVTSTDSVKAQIQKVIEAYRQLQENSQDISSGDMSAAYAGMVSKLKAISSAYRDAGAAARTSGQESSQSATAIEAAFSKLGVSSTSQVKEKIQDVIAAYRTLRDSGEVSARDLNAAHAAMVEKLQGVASAYKSTGASADSGMGEAEQAAKAAETALATLGVKSAPQVKARIQEIIAAYRTLRDSGTLSAKDLEAAHAAMVTKITDVSTAYKSAGQGGAALGSSLSGFFSKANSALEQLSQGLFNMRTAVAAIVTSVATGSFVKTANQFDKFESSLKTVTGSAEGAKEALAWVTDFASRTPYQIDKVTEAYIRLATRGFDPKETLQTLGDTAAAFNKDLIEVVEAFTDAATGEFERLKEFGVTASVAGDQVTLNWLQNGQQMQKTVSKTASAITSALAEIWKNNNSGAMDSLAKTVGGVWSNLQDAFTKFQNAVMKDGGVWDWLLQKLNAVQTGIDTLQNNGKLDEYARDIGAALQTAGEWIWSFGEKAVAVADMVASSFKAMGKLSDYIPTAAFGAFGITLKNLTTWGALVVAALGALGTAFLALKPVIVAVRAVLEAFSFLKWAGSAATLAKAIGALSTSFTALKVLLASLTAGPLAVLAAAFVFAATQIWRFVSAVKGAHDAQETAGKATKLAADKAKEAGKVWEKVGEMFGVPLHSLEDFQKACANGTIKLDKLNGTAANSPTVFKALGEAFAQAGQKANKYFDSLGSNYDTAAKFAAAEATTEEGAAARTLQVQRDKYKAVMAAADDYYTKQLALIEKEGGSETQKATLIKSLAESTKEAKIKATQDYIKDLQSSLDAAISAEKNFAKEALRAHESTEETIRNLRRQTMTASQAYNDQMAEAWENVSKAEKAAATGTLEGYKLAGQYAEKAESQFKSSVSAGKDVVGETEAIRKAMEGAAAAGTVWENSQKEGEKKAEDWGKSLVAQIMEAKAELESMQKSLDFTVTFKPETTDFDKKIDELAGKKVSMPAELQLDPAYVEMEINKIVVQTGEKIEAIKLKANTDEITKSIESLQNKNTTSEHTVSDNVDEILDKIKKLQGDNTSSTHTIYEKTVPEYASGGSVGRQIPAMTMPGEYVIDPEAAGAYAPLLRAVNSLRYPVQAFAGGGGVFRPHRSGLIPGVGDEDTEPVMLPEGAFVVRKAAVRKYGSGLMEAIQNFRLPPGVQAFASGGFVLPDWLRRLRRFSPASIPAASPAADGSVPPRPAAPSPESVAMAAPAAAASLGRPLAAPKGTSSRGVAAVSRLDSLRSTAALKFSSGGDLDETLADIATERQRTKEDYDEAVQDAKNDHDDQLADLLAQEQSDLDDIAATLASTLADLQSTWAQAQADYQDALTAAQESHDKSVSDAESSSAAAVQSAKDEYDSQKASLQSDYDDAQDAYTKWKKRDKTEYGYTKTELGDTSLVPSAGKKTHVSYYLSDKQALADYKEEGVGLKETLDEAKGALDDLGVFKISSDISSALTDAKAEAESTLSDAETEAQTTLADAQTTYTSGTADAQDTAASDTQTTKDKAQSDQADLDKDLADKLDALKKDYDRTMEDLATEESRARADADEEKGYSISGFSQWLAEGGPVKALARLRHFAEGGFVGLLDRLPHFAGGGAVPLVPGATAGTDSVLGALTPGEGVVNLQAMTRILSEKALDALNNLDLAGFVDELPHFATGGVVPGGDVASVAALAGPAGGSGESGAAYTATLNLAVGGKSFETRTTAASATALARELRRMGVNVK